MPAKTLTDKTRLLDYGSAPIQNLIKSRNWKSLTPFDRIGAVYDFVRDEILFGYNCNDAIKASEVLADRYGQCNTKAILLMALLRGLDIPCRLHGFTIHKSLQRGVVPELLYWRLPDDIVHSWVEVFIDEKWIKLEGFILDRPYLESLQRAFKDESETLCAFAVGTSCLVTPQVEWDGTDTFIQNTGINQDLGVYEAPDRFYAEYRQQLSWLLQKLYSYGLRHWLNARVRAIRNGHIPALRDTQFAFKKREGYEASPDQQPNSFGA
jgi:hypothetical protein